MAYGTAWFGATSGFLALALGIATVLQNGEDTGVRRGYLSVNEGVRFFLEWGGKALDSIIYILSKEIWLFLHMLLPLTKFNCRIQQCLQN
jgi:hypothetical protein